MIKDIENVGGLYNIRASRILKPYNPKLSLIDGIRLERMKNELRKAARCGEIYHIWWHPHNLGANMEANFSFLENLLKCFVECKEKYGMRSLNMSEVVEEIKRTSC